jgi:hypothetical protein
MQKAKSFICFAVNISTVWDPYTQTDINKVEAVQRRAARYVANNHRNRSSVSNIIQRLKWRPLADRRKDARRYLASIIFFLLVTLSTVHLSGWNFMHHSFSQCPSLSRSFCRVSASLLLDIVRMGPAHKLYYQQSK